MAVHRHAAAEKQEKKASRTTGSFRSHAGLQKQRGRGRGWKAGGGGVQKTLRGRDAEEGPWLEILPIGRPLNLAAT